MGAHPALRTSAPSPSHHHKQHTHSPGIGIREPSAAVGPSYGAGQLWRAQNAALGVHASSRTNCRSDGVSDPITESRCGLADAKLSLFKVSLYRRHCFDLPGRLHVP